MNNKSYSYAMYEGSFMTPLPIVDRTLNLLMFRDPEEKIYQILITRATLDEDQTVEQWCEIEIEKLRNSLPAFEIEGKMLTHEIGPGKLPVIQVGNRYMKDGELVRQVQSIVKLPGHHRYNYADREILVFSLNSIDEFTEFQRKHYVQVINSFVPEV